MAGESAEARAFLDTPEWAAIRHRIMGDGRPPKGRATSLADVSRLLRWKADGAYSPGHSLTEDERDAYLDAANEVDAFSQSAGRVAPVSPAAPAAPARTAVPSAPAWKLSFAEALTAVRAGGHVTRDAWPAGMWVTAQAGYPQGIGMNENTAKATGLPVGTVAVFGPYLMRLTPPKTATVEDGVFVDQPPQFGMWTPDHDDLFADDWRTLPRP